MGLISSSLLSLFSGLFLIKIFFEFFQNNNILKKNYRGEKIPLAAGLIFPLGYLISMIPLVIVFEASNYLFKFSYVLIGFSILGFLDDLMGEDSYKGLKGHIFNFLFNQKVTTGFIKAFFGFILALVVTLFFINIYFENFLLLILNTLIIALSANAMNSLDLRPGRACKVFILISIILYFITRFWEFMHIIPLLLMILVYLPGDLKGKYMLGDAGSNALGAFLGIYFVFFLEYDQKLLLLIFLVLFHVLTEAFSLTVLIEKTPVLSHLDKWGRNRN